MKLRETVRYLGEIFEIGFKYSFFRELGYNLNISNLLQRYNFLNYLWKDIVDTFFELGILAFQTTKPKPFNKEKLIFHNGNVESLFNKGKYPKGNFLNADLLLDYRRKRKRILRVYELTLTRGGIDLDSLEVNPLSDLGLFVNINLPLDGYIKKLLNSFSKILQGEKRKNTQIKGEFIKLLQAFSYALDYLIKVDGEIDLLEIYVVYPTKESFNVVFNTRRYYTTSTRKETLKQLHKEIIEKLKQFDNNGISFPINFEEKKKKRYEKKIIKPLLSISEVRNKVRETVFKEAKEGEILMLLHTPSTGKTTSVRKFANQFNECLFIYFSSRLKIIDEVAKKLEEDGFSILRSEVRSKEKEKYLTVSFLKREGNLKTLWKEFITKEKINNKEAILTTIPSLTTTKTSNTANYLPKIIKHYLEHFPNGKVILAVDEILGSDTGINSLLLMLKALKEAGLLNKIYLFWFDASLYNGKIAETLLNFSKAGYIIHPHINFSRYIENYNFTFCFENKNIKVKTYFLPSYPAKELIIEHKLLEIKLYPNKSELNKTKIIKKKVEKILQEFEESPEGLAVYNQDKEEIKKIADILREQNIKVQIATTYQTVDLNNIKNSIVLFTSALSRGVDIPFRKMLVFTPSFALEDQLVELLQTLYRLRDGINDEKEIKKIVLYYPYYYAIGSSEEVKNQKFEEITSLRTIINKLIYAYINPKIDYNYPIPIPLLSRAKYRQGFNEIVEVIKFLKEEFEIIPEIKFLFGKLEDIKKIKIEYPYVYFYETKGTFEIFVERWGEYKDREKFIEGLQKNPKIPLEKKHKIIDALFEFEEREGGWIFRRILTADFVLYLPVLVNNFKLKRSVINKRGYSIIKTPAYIRKEDLEDIFTIFNINYSLKFARELIPIFLLEKAIDETGKVIRFPTLPLFSLSF